MRHNPLVRPIAEILRSQTQPLSEYQLIQRLDLEPLDIGTDAENNSDLALFRYHFLVMNALYTLQPIFHEEGFFLSISALEISLQPARECHQHLPFQTAEHKLREYYLDWDELESSTCDTVDQLLNSFWQRYLTQDKLDEALNTLNSDRESTWPEIQNNYRRLASSTHPDKGGNTLTFLKVREAYEVLTQHKSLF